jgi:hypothetical protein
MNLNGTVKAKDQEVKVIVVGKQTETRTAIELPSETR